MGWLPLASSWRDGYPYEVDEPLEFGNLLRPPGAGTQVTGLTSRQGAILPPSPPEKVPLLQQPSPPQAPRRHRVRVNQFLNHTLRPKEEQQNVEGNQFAWNCGICATSWR